MIWQQSCLTIIWTMCFTGNKMVDKVQSSVINDNKSSLKGRGDRVIQTHHREWWSFNQQGGGNCW